jgi:hypothetical protein
MALYGCDVPTGKGVDHQRRRDEIIDIVAPYCFSKEDMEDYLDYPEHIRDLWLMSFTNSQNVMIWAKLMPIAKRHFRSYFPDKGASPRLALGRKIGLQAGQSILDR